VCYLIAKRFFAKKVSYLLSEKKSGKNVAEIDPRFSDKKIGSTPEIRPNDEKVLFENQIIVCRKVEKHLTSKFIIDK